MEYESYDRDLYDTEIRVEESSDSENENNE